MARGRRTTGRGYLRQVPTVKDSERKEQVSMEEFDTLVRILQITSALFGVGRGIEWVVRWTIRWKRESE